MESHCIQALWQLLIPISTRRGGIEALNGNTSTFPSIALRDKRVCLKRQITFACGCAWLYKCESKNGTDLSVCASVFPHHHLSARTSRGVFPWAQLLTIQPESMAAKKPRAMPVPMGQNGCETGARPHSITKYGKEQQEITNKGKTQM